MVGKNELTYPLGQAFFGLTPKQASRARVAIYDQIHEICFYGKGGYNWDTAYSFPIWLRKRIHGKISDFYSEQNTQYKNASKGDNNKQTAVNPDGTVNKQVFNQNQPPNSKTVSYK